MNHRFAGEMVCTKWMDLQMKARLAPNRTLIWYVPAHGFPHNKEAKIEFDYARFRDVVEERCIDRHPTNFVPWVPPVTCGIERTSMVVAWAGKMPGTDGMEPALCFSVSTRNEKTSQMQCGMCAVNPRELDRLMTERVAELWARLRLLTRQLVFPALHLERLSFQPRANGEAPKHLLDEMEEMQQCAVRQRVD